MSEFTTLSGSTSTSTTTTASNTVPLLSTVDRPTKASHLSAAATLGATLLGSGVLAQPEACENIGIVPFIIMSLLAVMLSHQTAMMLCKTSCYLIKQQLQEQEYEAQLATNGGEEQNEEGDVEPITKSLTYAEVASKVFGKHGRVLTMCAVTIMQIGCCIAYVVVIGDIFGPLAQYWLDRNVAKQYVVSLVVVIVILPLTVFVRSMSSLKYTSTFTVTVVVTAAMIIIGNSVFVLGSRHPDDRRIELIHEDDYLSNTDLEGPYLFPRKWFDFLKSISIVLFAYFMHFNVMPVLHTIMEQGNNVQEVLDTYNRASSLSFSVAVCCTGGVGVFGYLTFLNFTKSDVLLNFHVQGSYISATFNVLKLLYGIALSFAYPIVIWEARENVKLMFVDKEKHHLFRVHALLSIALVFVTLAVGSVINDLSIVFGFIGSTCTPIIAYILPSAVYMRSGAAKHHEDERLPQFAFAFGLAVIPFGLTMWLMDLAQN